MKLLHILILGIIAVCSADDGLFVKVENGMLHGTILETKEGREINAFLGIPYAKPPVGKLRFKAPVPYDDWEGVRDATKEHVSCPQRNIFIRTDLIEGDEDCLFLNVYKPKTEKEKLLPVMIFFHGGGYLCGHGNTENYGPNVLLDRDVILVIPNYRLGALGFLSTGDEVCPGNNGMKDQSLAIKWVHDNIEKFGGDPNSVTLFGESAGGASVHMHMLSPLSRGLFHKGISQSGTVLCPWAFDSIDRTRQHSIKLGKLFDCPTDSSEEMVECLRKIDPYDIIAKDEDYMVWDKHPMMPFKPTVEPDLPGAFLSEHPIDMIKAGKVMKVPWISGVNKDDGALTVAALYGEPHLIEELNSDFINKSGEALEFKYLSDDPVGIAKKVQEFYFKGKSLNKETVQEVVNLFTDGLFMNGIDLATYLHTKLFDQKIYYYLFEHRGHASFTAHFGDKINDYGVCHADELMYLFPINEQLFPNKLWNEKDKQMAKILTTMWVNFATYGEPTPFLDDLITAEWKPTNHKVMNYLSIKADNLQMKDGLYLDRMLFWRNIAFHPKNKLSVRDEL